MCNKAAQDRFLLSGEKKNFYVDIYNTVLIYGYNINNTTFIIFNLNYGILLYSLQMFIVKIELSYFIT